MKTLFASLLLFSFTQSFASTGKMNCLLETVGISHQEQVQLTLVFSGNGQVKALLEGEELGVANISQRTVDTYKLSVVSSEMIEVLELTYNPRNLSSRSQMKGFLQMGQLMNDDGSLGELLFAEVIATCSPIKK